MRCSRCICPTRTTDDQKPNEQLKRANILVGRKPPSTHSFSASLGLIPSAIINHSIGGNHDAVHQSLLILAIHATNMQTFTHSCRSIQNGDKHGHGKKETVHGCQSQLKRIRSGRKKALAMQLERWSIAVTQSSVSRGGASSKGWALSAAFGNDRVLRHVEYCGGRSRSIVTPKCEHGLLQLPTRDNGLTEIVGTVRAKTQSLPLY